MNQTTHFEDETTQLEWNIREGQQSVHDEKEVNVELPVHFVI